MPRGERNRTILPLHTLFECPGDASVLDPASRPAGPRDAPPPTPTNKPETDLPAKRIGEGAMICIPFAGERR